MRQIEDSASEALTVLQALESLARLAWNDDDVREQVAQMDGMHRATCMIRQHTVKAECISIYSCTAGVEPAFCGMELQAQHMCVCGWGLRCEVYAARHMQLAHACCSLQTPFFSALEEFPQLSDHCCHKHAMDIAAMREVATVSVVSTAAVPTLWTTQP